MTKLFTLVLIVLPIFSQAREIRFSKKIETVEIKWEMIDPLNPKIGLKPTHLRFPKPVHRFDNVTLFRVEAAKIKGGQSDYRELKIYPRKVSGSQNIEVVLQDRSVIRLKLKISKKNRASLSYDFKPERIHADSKPERISTDLSEMDVMRAALQGQTVDGMTRKNISNWVRCKGSGIRGKVFRVYEGRGFKVFQVRLKNTSSWKQFKLSPHDMHFTKRNIYKPVLKHVEKEILKPKGFTIVTMLGDKNVSIWKSKICDVGKQAILVNSKNKRKRGKS